MNINGKAQEADLIRADIDEIETILHHMNLAALEEVGSR